MYYVDRYLGELVKEKDNFAASERYYEYKKGQDGIIIETYIVDYHSLKLIDFIYTIDEDRKLVSIHRDNFFKDNGLFNNHVLYAYTVPPEWYESETAKVKERKNGI